MPPTRGGQRWDGNAGAGRINKRSVKTLQIEKSTAEMVWRAKEALRRGCSEGVGRKERGISIFINLAVRRKCAWLSGWCMEGDNQKQIMSSRRSGRGRSRQIGGSRSTRIGPGGMWKLLGAGVHAARALFLFIAAKVAARYILYLTRD